MVPGASGVIFEAVHGTAPDIAGKWIANRAPMLRSAILMVELLKFPEIAVNIDRALRTVLREGKLVTRDLGGQATTREMCKAIIDNLT